MTEDLGSERRRKGFLLLGSELAGRLSCGWLDRKRVQQRYRYLLVRNAA